MAAEHANGTEMSAPRQVVAYLFALRPIMSSVTEQRRGWIREVGHLIEEARTGDSISLSRQAGRLGHGQVMQFREARLQVTHLVPPVGCEALHQSVVDWIEKHVEACETLMRAEQSRSLRPLREAQEQLGDARRNSQRFNEEYVRVVAELRERVDAALKRQGRGRSRRRGRQTGGGVWSSSPRKRSSSLSSDSRSSATSVLGEVGVPSAS